MGQLSAHQGLRLRLYPDRWGAVQREFVPIVEPVIVGIALMRAREIDQYLVAIRQGIAIRIRVERIRAVCEDLRPSTSRRIRVRIQRVGQVGLDLGHRSGIAIGVGVQRIGRVGFCLLTSVNESPSVSG